MILVYKMREPIMMSFLKVLAQSAAAPDLDQVTWVLRFHHLIL